jgi:hypothetical protein
MTNIFSCLVPHEYIKNVLYQVELVPTVLTGPEHSCRLNKIVTATHLWQFISSIL